MQEQCGKNCKYNPKITHKAISMHHCPLCGQMQIAGLNHTCTCFKCYNEIVEYFGAE